MNIEQKECKNGLKTFLVDSIYYHSVYDPIKEAQRFCESINFESSPKQLFLIENGYDYAFELLKQKFPDSNVINIRIFGNNEIPYDNDDIFYQNFHDCLLKIESDTLINSQIICWPTATKVFPQIVSEIIEEYKKSFEFAKTVLVTKQYFEKKWLKNSMYFYKGLNRIGKLNKINEDILIVASGPSLYKSINCIKQNQQKFYIIALSSAINPLVKNGITPDLCISTDGGFWATKHLYPLIKNDIPLAIAIEGALPKQLLKKNLIIPLVYNQGLASEIYKKTGLDFTMAQSCPTVSETAVKLSCEITSKNIYIAGLDLCTRKGFAHTQPNILEIENSLKDSRLIPTMQRISASEINGKTSLNAYQASFSFENYSKCYRIIDEEITNHINTMNEIDYKKFQIICNEKKLIEKNKLIEEKTKEEINYSKIKDIVLNYINENQLSEGWKKNLFPLDYAVLNHLNDKEKNEKLEIINDKNNEYIEKIRKLINEN